MIYESIMCVKESCNITVHNSEIPLSVNHIRKCDGPIQYVPDLILRTGVKGQPDRVCGVRGGVL